MKGDSMRNVLIVIAALALGLLVVGGPSSAHAGPPQSSNVLGDADCSGAVTALDALADVQAAAAIPGGPPCLTLGNVICTDATGIDDAIAILRWLGGLDPKLPDECPVIGVQPVDIAIFSSGDGTIHGTYLFDLDTGTETGMGADLWWQNTGTFADQHMVLNGANGSSLALLPGRAFDDVSVAELMEQWYADTPIAGANLPDAAVFAVHTSSGNFAKVLVVHNAFDLDIRWVTYGVAN
jgi:hypothetical protein